MRLTTTRLKKIIREETRKVLWEQTAPNAEAIAAEASQMAEENPDLVADIQDAANDGAVQAALAALSGYPSKTTPSYPKITPSDVSREHDPSNIRSARTTPSYISREYDPSKIRSSRMSEGLGGMRQALSARDAREYDPGEVLQRPTDRTIPTIAAAGAASTASGLGLLDAAFKVSLSAGGDPGLLQDLVVALQNAGVDLSSVLMAGGSMTALGIATLAVAFSAAVVDYVD